MYAASPENAAAWAEYSRKTGYAMRVVWLPFAPWMRTTVLGVAMEDEGKNTGATRRPVAMATPYPSVSTTTTQRAALQSRCNPLTDALHTRKRKFMRKALPMGDQGTAEARIAEPGSGGGEDTTQYA